MTESYGDPIDILSLSHFINYFMVGLYVKNNHLLAFVIGIIWEIMEYIIVNIPYTRKLVLQYWPITIKRWENKWNKMFDIIFNMLGYMVGNYIKN